MEVHAGKGGDDSKLFVHDLFAAYVKYAKSKGLKVEILDSIKGEVTCRISGPKAAKRFSQEAGVHCIQRVPPTEKNGRRQTSFVMVAVLPMPPKHEVKLLPESELEVKTAVGQGPGGQHRNRTESCVRMIHRPTKMEVVIDGRNQHQNRREAHRILSVKVAKMKAREDWQEYDQRRKNQIGDGGGSDKIRTYNYIQSRAVDHRNGKKTTKVKDVIEKGRIELLM